MTQRNLALAYLKATVIVLVVAFHSSLAYIVWASFDPMHYLQTNIPIVDTVRWLGLDFFVHINNNYFMALMFFVSGLFIWPSLNRKGNKAFLWDRVYRLGVPFAVMVLFFMPIAQYPAYLVSGSDVGILAYLRQFYSIDGWPSGQAWFVWVLLAFNVALVALVALIPGSVTALRWIGEATERHSLAFFFSLIVLTGIPVVFTLYTFHPDNLTWVHFGPFAIQLSRLALYFIYFLAAVGISIHGIDRGILTSDGLLVRRWAFWLLAGVASVALLLLVFGLSDRIPPSLLPGVRGFAFVITCASLSFAMLALFLRFGNRPCAIFDSLQKNAFGIYVFHYVFVIWAQYLILTIPLPAVVKASIVFAVALAISWAISDAVRRVPAIGRFL